MLPKKASACNPKAKVGYLPLSSSKNMSEPKIYVRDRSVFIFTVLNFKFLLD